jgi:chemotaxis signal transduction protein
VTQSDREVGARALASEQEVEARARTREHDLEILRARARRLAEPAPTLGLDETHAQQIVFVRAGVRYALDVAYVRELLALSEYVSVPFAPAACLGLCSARGELLALFDLAALVGTPVAEAPSLLLLCGEPARELALAVDEAIDLVAKGPLQAPPVDHEGPVLGLDERGFLVLDGEALLNDPRLTIDPKHAETGP